MFPDLIETLWNVKEYQKLNGETGVDDLIETLWNVKRIASFSSSTADCRFNRDIVECKARAVLGLPAIR